MDPVCICLPSRVLLAAVLPDVQKKLTFEITRINVRLGLWKTGFNLKSGLIGGK